MKELKKLNLKDLLFLDIQTSTEYGDIPVASLKTAKNKWKTEDYDSTNLEYQANGALHPEFARIICVVLAYYRDGNVTYKVLQGEESSIIKEFYSIVGNFILTGFNISKFDLPFIRLRGMVHGIEVPDNLDDRLLKIWDVGLAYNSKIKLVDLLDIVKGLYPYYFSLDALCNMMGIKNEGGIDGSEVTKAYYEGRLEEIIEYCKRDVNAVIQILLKLRGETIVNKPLIYEILESKSISLEQLEKIKPFYNSLKEDEKMKVQEIILACLINKGEGDFFTGKDDAATIAYKEELVKSLEGVPHKPFVFKNKIYTSLNNG